MGALPEARRGRVCRAGKRLSRAQDDLETGARALLALFGNPPGIDAYVGAILLHNAIQQLTNTPLIRLTGHE